MSTGQHAQISHFVILLDHSHYVIYIENGVIDMRIKEIRMRKDISQKELAAALGIAPNTLSQYENGKREPDIKTLERISDFLNVTIDCLLGRSQKKAAPKDGDGQNQFTKRFMTLVDGLTPDQKELLLAQLQAWTEQNKKQALAAQLSGGEKVPESDS